jgi:hypothetical protein
MSEAYLLQKDFENAEKIIKKAETIFPGEKLLFDKLTQIKKHEKISSKKEKSKFKKMFAKK